MNILQKSVQSSSSEESEQLKSLTNLQNCVRSAASVASSASTTLANDQPDHFSVAYGSEFGDVLPAQPGETMMRWISSNTVYEFEEEPNSDLGSGGNEASGKPLKPIDERSGSEQSDSDNDLEAELVQAMLNKGKEKFEAKDYKGAERLFKNCLTRTSSSGSLVSLHRIPKSKSEIMNLLLDSYLAQEKWGEAQAMLLEKIAFTSRDKSKDDGVVLADILTLIDVLLNKKSYVEALLYGRRAFKGYKKLGLEGIEGVEKSLRVLVRVCHLDDNFDEEDAYATMLTDFLKKNPPPSQSTNHSNPSLPPPAPPTPTPTAETSHADQNVSNQAPAQETAAQQVPSKQASAPEEDKFIIKEPKPRPRWMLSGYSSSDKLPTREECLAITDEQCEFVLLKCGSLFTKTLEDLTPSLRLHLIRLYLTRMSFPEIKEYMKTAFGVINS